jgi:hypothetical protein
MTKLNQANPCNEAYSKYTRSRLIGLFDSLDSKADFQDLTLSDFPLRTTSPRRRRTTQAINLDEDSDASLSVDFYSVFHRDDDDASFEVDDNLHPIRGKSGNEEDTDDGSDVEGSGSGPSDTDEL